MGESKNVTKCEKVFNVVGDVSRDITPFFSALKELNNINQDFSNDKEKGKAILEMNSENKRKRMSLLTKGIGYGLGIGKKETKFQIKPGCSGEIAPYLIGAISSLRENLENKESNKENFLNTLFVLMKENENLKLFFFEIISRCEEKAVKIISDYVSNYQNSNNLEEKITTFEDLIEKDEEKAKEIISQLMEENEEFRRSMEEL